MALVTITNPTRQGPNVLVEASMPDGLLGTKKVMVQVSGARIAAKMAADGVDEATATQALISANFPNDTVLPILGDVLFLLRGLLGEVQQSPSGPASGTGSGNPLAGDGSPGQPGDSGRMAGDPRSSTRPIRRRRVVARKQTRYWRLGGTDPTQPQYRPGRRHGRDEDD